MQNVIYSVTKIAKDQPEVTVELSQAHINEILELVRGACNLGQGETMSLSRLEVLDDIIQSFAYELGGR